MTEPAFLHPQIEVLATRPRRDALFDKLRRSGFRPIAGQLPQSLAGATPVLADLASLPPQDISALREASLRGANAELVLLRPTCASPVRLRDAIILNGDGDLASLAARLDLRQRQMLRQSELDIRRAIFAELGGAPGPSTAEAKPPQILFVGPVGASFNPLHRAFARKGGVLHGALSRQNALRLLDTGAFAACLIDLAEDGPGLDLVADLAARPRPGLRVAALGDIMQGATAQVVDEIIAPDLSPDAIAVCVHELVDTPELQPHAGHIALTSRTHDPFTGLFSRDFLRTCLKRQLQACEAHEQSLSLLSLRLAVPRGREPVSPQQMLALAGWLCANLRMTDLAARIDKTSVMISMRATPYSGAVTLARRIEALFASREDAGGARELAGLSLSWRVAERRLGNSADMLIQSALAGPFHHSPAT